MFITEWLVRCSFFFFFNFTDSPLTPRTPFKFGNGRHRFLDYLLKRYYNGRRRRRGLFYGYSTAAVAGSGVTFALWPRDVTLTPARPTRVSGGPLAKRGAQCVKWEQDGRHMGSSNYSSYNCLTSWDSYDRIPR